eukprot:COSAG04_NODE_718_length_10851_cov_8.135231_7_plen_72_part_00
MFSTIYTLYVYHIGHVGLVALAAACRQLPLRLIRRLLRRAAILCVRRRRSTRADVQTAPPDGAPGLVARLD